MCISAEVDLVAGVSISAIAIESIRIAMRPETDKALLPLATLPAVFAAHTFSSAVVWLGYTDRIGSGFADAATTFYLFIAFVFLPVFVPFAIYFAENTIWRRKLMLVLVFLGALASIDFGTGLVTGGGSAVPCTNYIDFNVVHSYETAGVFYAIATCGALLLSGFKSLFWWGVLNTIALTTFSLTVSSGAPSLWCLAAAITSGFVWWFLRSQTKNQVKTINSGRAVEFPSTKH